MSIIKHKLKTKLAENEIILGQKKEEMIQEDEKEVVTNNINLNSRNDNYAGKKLLMATNMQIGLQEEALRKEFFENEEDEDDISSDYDKGLEDL